MVEALPLDEGWQFEPKWDGFRCLAFRDGRGVELRAKSGKSLTRFFPEVAERIAALPEQDFVIDGELVVPSEGSLSFDALQMRLHPAASRIARLSREQPATLIAFDCLADAKALLIERPLVERRTKLEGLFTSLGPHQGLDLSPFTRNPSQARRWLLAEPALDGVIAKRLDEPYRSGERAMLKVKNIRTADCVVGGFRYESGRALVGSLLLGLYDPAGLLHHVGFTSGLAAKDKPELTARLEALIERPGFTGDAPGGPSRWSTERSTAWQPLRPELVIEVRYDHVTADRFRHGTRLLRWRPDKAPQQCTLAQIAPATATGSIATLPGALPSATTGA